MSKTVQRLLLALITVIPVLISGCALDPMEKLSEDIDSEDVAVRKAAVLQLANLRDDRAIEALVEVLVNDEVLYDMAGVALVKQGRDVVTKRKPDPIITMAGNAMKNIHSSLGNRARAAWVLGEIGDREAVPVLREGTTTKTAAAEEAVPVQDQAKLSLKKLGNDSDGQAFELPMGTFTSGEVSVLPKVKSVEPPETAAEKADKAAAAAEDAKARKAAPAEDQNAPEKA
jgi:HEAT repeat protein